MNLRAHFGGPFVHMGFEFLWTDGKSCNGHHQKGDKGNVYKVKV